MENRLKQDYIVIAVADSREDLAEIRDELVAAKKKKEEEGIAASDAP